MNVMATNATTIKNGACWYGLHFGCLYTNDPNCTKCAERLAHAVNGVLRAPGSAALTEFNVLPILHTHQKRAQAADAFKTAARLDPELLPEPVLGSGYSV
jgi:hypothetical protein